jgi:hypothetical protein
MTILTILFFAVFGLVSGFVEHSMRQENIANGITAPLDHGKLVQRRVIVGVAWLFVCAGFEILFGNFSWKILLLIPLAMGTFAPFHRLTINYAVDRGPWYLGVDSRIDRTALELAGMSYIYDTSAQHFEAWSESLGYRKVVTKAAKLLYLTELTVAVVAAYITLT